MCWSPILFDASSEFGISLLVRYTLFLMLVIYPICYPIHSRLFDKKYPSGFTFMVEFLYMEIYFVFCLSFVRVLYMIYEFLRCADVSKVTLCTLRIFCYSGDFQGIAFICSQIDVLAILGSTLGMLVVLMYVKVKFGTYKTSS